MISYAAVPTTVILPVQVVCVSLVSEGLSVTFSLPFKEKRFQWMGGTVTEVLELLIGQAELVRIKLIPVTVKNGCWYVYCTILSQAFEKTFKIRL